MMSAIVDEVKVGAFPGGLGACPICGADVRAKCGSMVTWHWAHVAGPDCDEWSEPDSAWHLGWQLLVDRWRREVVIGNHRADLIAADMTVVELQHSTISAQEIAEREKFYGRMVWVFDAIDAYRDERLYISRRLGGDKVTFRWKHPRKTVAACRRPVLLDLGDSRLLSVKRIHPAAPCGGWGRLLSRDAFEQWIGGTR